MGLPLDLPKGIMMVGLTRSNIHNVKRMAMFGLIVSGRLVSTSWEQAGPTNVIAEIQVGIAAGALWKPEFNFNLINNNWFFWIGVL